MKTIEEATGLNAGVCQDEPPGTDDDRLKEIE